MKPFICLALLISLFLLYGCKKQKPIVFSGQLLLTQKYPFPLSNKKVELYQAGGGSAILFNSSSSIATSVTDANGYFKITFIPGTSSFGIFSTASSNSLSLSSAIDDRSFPNFYRNNFPEQGYDAAKPIFIGKTIDTAIIKVRLSKNLTATDTIGLRGYSVIGILDKEYTGRVASAGTTIIIDTIKNLLFTEFDCLDSKFINTIYAGRKTTNSGYVTISTEGVISPYKLLAADETKNEILFYFNK